MSLPAILIQQMRDIRKNKHYERSVNCFREIAYLHFVCTITILSGVIFNY